MPVLAQTNPQSASLFLLTIVPFIGAIFAAMIKNQPQRLTRLWALIIGFATFVLSLLVVADATDGSVATWGMDPGNTIGIAQIDFFVRFSCDGISGWLLLLTTLLTPLAILSVGSKIDDQPNARWFYVWILVLLGSLIGCFVAADALLFYFFFELTLVPCLLLIGIWGGPQRRAAAGKFFIYTFAGSIFMLIGLLYLGDKAHSFEISRLVAAAQDPHVVSPVARFWLALAFLVGFLVKTPVFPLHTWQAQTYTESPNSLTVLLAAVMSKLGTYGLLRLTLPIGFVGAANDPCIASLTHWIVILCIISIIYGGLIAWVQKDMARIMAFSSVSHLGVCVLAIFASSTLSMQGAVMYMLAHGLSTAALFFLIGFIADRTGTRNITEISGLFKSMPVAGTLLVLFTMASIGLPITSGFVGEFLSLQGIMTKLGLGTVALASAGIILGAIYMLNMVAKVGFGPEKAPAGAELKDLCGRDLAVLLPIAAAVLLLGIQPTPVLDSFKKDVAMIRTTGLSVDVTPGPAQSEEAAFQGAGK